MVIDALFLAINKIESSKELQSNIYLAFNNQNLILKENRKIILVTGHRRENFGKSFIDICESLKAIALANPDIDIVYPVHLNPNVQNPVKKILSNISNIYLIEPLSYEKFIYLMKLSYFIITDSGGVQEEAPSLGKPVLVMRDTTERPEAVEIGTVILVGTNKEKIIDTAQRLLSDKQFYDNMATLSNPYGEGTTARQIVEFLKERL